MAESRFDDFLPGDKVERVEDGAAGVVHHAKMDPGSDWVFAVNFPDGTQVYLSTAELRAVEDETA